MAIEVPPVSRTACSSITSYRSSDLGAKEIEQFQLESVESCETQRQKDQDINVIKRVCTALSREENEAMGRVRKEKFLVTSISVSYAQN